MKRYTELVSGCTCLNTDDLSEAIKTATKHFFKNKCRGVTEIYDNVKKKIFWRSTEKL